MVLLPLFTLFYAFVSPSTASQVWQAHMLMMAVMIAIAFGCSTVKRLELARLLSLAGYALLCMGVAVVTTVIVTQDGTLYHPSWLAGMAETNDRSLQFTELASYLHILLSIIIMPFTVAESAVVIAIVTSSLSWGLYRPVRRAPHHLCRAAVRLAHHLVSGSVHHSTPKCLAAARLRLVL